MGVVFVVEVDVEVFGRGLGADDRIRVEFLDPEVDRVEQGFLGVGAVVGGVPGDRGIDQRQSISVLDQVGAPGDRIDDGGRDRAGGEQGGGAGQLVAQRCSDAHLLGRGVGVQIAGRRDLGLRPGPAVDDLVGGAVVLVVAVAGHHFADQRQPVRCQGGFTPGRGRHCRDERSVAPLGESRPIHDVEHVFERSRGVRHVRRRGQVAIDAIRAQGHDCPTTTVHSLSEAPTLVLGPETRTRAIAVAGTIRADGAARAAEMLLNACTRPYETTRGT